MNMKDKLFIVLAVIFLVAGIVTWIVYAFTKRWFLKKLATMRETEEEEEESEFEEERAPSVQDLYVYVNILQARMLKKQDELYDERQNMSCERLGSKDGERFVKGYEHFSAAVDMLGDVREYMRLAVEVDSE